MSDPCPSGGWTPRTLYEHFSSRLADMEKALVAARQDMERRLAGMNEFRAAISDQAKKFVDRNEADVRFRSLEKDIASHASRLDRSEGRGAGLSAGWVVLLGAIGAIGALVAIFLALKGG